MPPPLLVWTGTIIFIAKVTLKIHNLFKADSRDFATDLPEVALDLLACPATSVPLERLFSISGILSEGRSSSISAEQLERRTLTMANPYL